MSKLGFAAAILILSGCASMGEWRTLTIDGSDQAAFGESLARLNEELSTVRSQMLALALVDIVQTGAESAGEGNDVSSSYTNENFRADLDGLTFDGIIALADQSGQPIQRQYYSGRRYFGGQRGMASNAATSEQQGFRGDDRFWPVTNSGAILSDAWKEPGFNASNFSFP